MQPKQNGKKSFVLMNLKLYDKLELQLNEKEFVDGGTGVASRCSRLTMLSDRLLVWCDSMGCIQYEIWGYFMLTQLNLTNTRHRI